MTSTGQGAGEGHEDSTTATPQRGTRDARKRGTQHATQQRVEYVLQLYVNGHAASEIMRKVAARHAKEAAARKQHAEHPDADDLPPLLWGTDEKAPAERTVARYISAAKRELEKGGHSVARLGDRLMGLQLARINRTWQMAVKLGKPAAMARVIEITNEMFAFDGAIRPALSALAATDTARTGDERKEPLPDATMTEETAADVLGGLLALARQRRGLQYSQPLTQPEPVTLGRN